MRTMAKLVSSLVVTLALLAGQSSGIQVKIMAETPSGVKFQIPDEGYNLVALHFSVNKPLAGVAAGDVNVDMRKPDGTNYEYENPNLTVKPGDTVNYWVNVLQNGVGKNLLDQSYTVPFLTTTTTTTTTRAPPATTTTTRAHPKDTTIMVNMNGVAHETVAPAASNQQQPSDVPPMAEDSFLTGQNHVQQQSNTKTDSGTCGCNNAAQSDSYNKEASCTTFPCLIFEDDFDSLDAKLWEHEINAGGGGNWEFQYYTNNRTNSYVRDSKLFLKPTLATDQWGPDYPEHGKLNLWGSQPASLCTGHDFWGCERSGMPGQVVNPIQSARLRSSRSFNFRYGRMEVEAMMPTGDWIWPAIWLLPRYNSYGNWPASGEIDLVESRGNLHYRDDKGQAAGADSVGSTLHFGPFAAANQWPKAHGTTTASSGTFADLFHKYTLDWDDKSIRCSVDGQEILNVTPPTGGFWELGEFEKNGHSKWDNPWAAGGHMAPFDQEF